MPHINSWDLFSVAKFPMTLRFKLLMSSKVKCTLVQALRLCTGRTAHRKSRGIALLFLDPGSRRGWEVSVTPRPLFTQGKDPVPIVEEAGWAPGPVWTNAENFAPTLIRSPDRPVRSQSLYPLRNPAYLNVLWIQEEGAQIHISEWIQGFTFTKNVGRSFIPCYTPPTKWTVWQSH